jgi:hypothetical protein
MMKRKPAMLGRLMKWLGPGSREWIEILGLCVLYMLGAWWMEHLGVMEWFWFALVASPFLLGFFISRPAVQSAFFWAKNILSKDKRWLKALIWSGLAGSAASIAFLQARYDFVSKHEVEAFVLGGTLGLIGLCFLLGYIAHRSHR